MLYLEEQARIQRALERAERMRLRGAYAVAETYRLQRIRPYVIVDEVITAMIDCYDSIERNGGNNPELRVPVCRLINQYHFNPERVRELMVAARTIRNAGRRGLNPNEIAYNLINHIVEH